MVCASLPSKVQKMWFKGCSVSHCTRSKTHLSGRFTVGEPLDWNERCFLAGGWVSVEVSRKTKTNSSKDLPHNKVPQASLTSIASPTRPLTEFYSALASVTGAGNILDTGVVAHGSDWPRASHSRITNPPHRPNWTLLVSNWWPMVAWWGKCASRKTFQSRRHALWRLQFSLSV